jgi:hypothetical protein
MCQFQKNRNYSGRRAESIAGIKITAPCFYDATNVKKRDYDPL